ncbi:hypothetical protein ACFW04_000253 [Cataglyphis niger]
MKKDRGEVILGEINFAYVIREDKVNLFFVLFLVCMCVCVYIYIFFFRLF